MRKKIYLWKNEKADFCFDFCGVGIIDFVKIFEAYDGKLYFYDELPTAFFEKDSIDLSLLKTFDIVNKINKRADELSEEEDLQQEIILEKFGLKNQDTGTSLIIKAAPRCKLPKLNRKDINDIFQTGVMPKEILGICMLHDNDWRVVCCFNGSIAQEIIERIKARSQAIIVRSRNELPT